jgi:hypothetical protein
MSTTVLEEDIEAPNGKTFTPFVPRPPSPTIHAVTSSLRGLEDAVLTVRFVFSPFHSLFNPLPVELNRPTDQRLRRLPLPLPCIVE